MYKQSDRKRAARLIRNITYDNSRKKGLIYDKPFFVWGF
ncbi:hypothetical protein JOD18_003908 [Gracilibacillus alcaliphilus]|nr:hypothetical protein [Gracilibacillus alcaliphilus]